MSRLGAKRYGQLCALVGSALDHPEPAVRTVGAHVGWPVAVYMLGHREPGSKIFTVDYVGSAIRRNSDVSARIREHLTDPRKRRQFTGQVILPLRHDLSVELVRKLEGTVARSLAVPRWCQRVPGGQRP